MFSCLLIAPVFTQSSDEFFLTASNQIVNDLRTLSPTSSNVIQHLSMSINTFRYREQTAGLETCFGRGCKI